MKVADPVVGDTLSVVTALGPSKGLPSRREFVQMALLPSAQGWPDALLQATPTECPCAVAVQEQIRDFFNATAQPAQPPVAALQPGRDRPGGC